MNAARWTHFTAFIKKFLKKEVRKNHGYTNPSGTYTSVTYMFSYEELVWLFIDFLIPMSSESSFTAYPYGFSYKYLFPLSFYMQNFNSEC